MLSEAEHLLCVPIDES